MFLFKKDVILEKRLRNREFRGIRSYFLVNLNEFKLGYVCVFWLVVMKRRAVRVDNIIWLKRFKNFFKLIV